MPKRSSRPSGSLAPLDNKVAIITGGSRGIGLAIAHALASAGCNLILTSRTSASLKKAAASLAMHRVGISTKTCDVSDPASVQDFFRFVSEHFKRIDFLVNNAGVGHPLAPVDKLPIAAWQKTINTNLNGLFYVSRAALPLMRGGGVIVNNLSISAVVNFPGNSGYDASKHGALGFTRTLREDVRARGIRVIALLPGATDTEIWQQFWPDAPREKMMAPETVAAVVLQALTLPQNASLDEIRIAPSAGFL